MKGMFIEGLCSGYREDLSVQTVDVVKQKGGCTPTTAFKSNDRTWRATWMDNVYIRCSRNKVSRSIELVVFLTLCVCLSLLTSPHLFLSLSLTD